MVDIDGTAPFSGDNLDATIDKVVVWHGTALPAGAANKVPQNGLFLKVDSLSAPTTRTWYIQTSATLSSPAFEEIPDSTQTLELLDSHVAGGTEASYTFTPASALDMVNTYREIIITVDGEATAAFNLELLINGLTTSYSYNYMRNLVTTLAGIDATSQSQWIIGDSSMITPGTAKFLSKVSLFCEGGANIMGLIQSLGPQASAFGMLQRNGVTSISSIKIETSTSTWKAGGEITIYGVRR